MGYRYKITSVERKIPSPKMKNYVSVQKELLHVFFCVDDAAEFFKIQKPYENSPTSKKTLSLRVLTKSSELWLKNDKLRLKKHVESEIANQEQLKASKTYHLVRAAV